MVFVQYFLYFGICDWVCKSLNCVFFVLYWVLFIFNLKFLSVVEQINNSIINSIMRFKIFSKYKFNCYVIIIFDEI